MEPVVFSPLVLAAAGIVIFLAALSDARRFRLPNKASLALLALFPLFVLTSEVAIPWEKHLLVFAAFFAVGYTLYVKGWAGAGDVKFAASIALWAGPSFWMPFIFLTAFAGGVLSLGIGLLVFVRHRVSKKEEPLKLLQTPIPYGVAIAVGGLCTLVLLSHPALLAEV